MDASDLFMLLEASLQSARSTESSSSPEKRSRAWVHAIATAFQQRYSAELDIRVFCRSIDDNRRQFSLNELLHDVTVARCASIQAPVHDTTLTYLCEVMWQIESEFANDTREALFDFNKLVLGSASNKLFIGPIGQRTDAVLQSLLPAARCCSGRVYIAMVPHPKDWLQRDVSIRLWSLEQDQWVPCPQNNHNNDLR